MSRHLAWLGLGMLSILGCRSLSPDADLAEAASRVESRLGQPVSWSTRAGSSVIEPTVLTVDDAIRSALEHPEIRARVAAVAEFRADLVQAGLIPNPVISLALGLPLDGRGGSPGAVGLVQQLASIWKRPARVDAAEADLRVRVLALSDAAVALAAEVGTRAAQLHHGRRLAELARRRVEVLGERLGLIEAIARAGEARRSVVNDAQLELARARQREVELDVDADQARRRFLERVWQRGSPPEFEGEGLPALDDAIPDEDALAARVTTQRLDVVAAFTALDGADARTRLAAWSRWPEVGAGVSIERNLENREVLLPSMQVSPPLFDDGRAATAHAAAIERRTEADAQRLLRSAILEVRLAHVSLEGARERWRRLEAELLPAAREELRLAEASASAGESTRLDVLALEAGLLAAEAMAEQEALAIRVAHYALVRAAGGSLRDLDEEAP